MSSKSSTSAFLRRLFLVATQAFIAGALTGCHLYLDDGYESPPRDEWQDDCWDCEVPPPGGPGGWECTTDDVCAAGCYCSDANWCEESGFCDEWTPCSTGFVCDDRSTCVPERGEPAQTCQSEVLFFCDEMAPICPAGSTPIIESSCYTGGCMSNEDCPDGAPFSCSELDALEDDCVSNAECSPVYKGVNCTSPTGVECSSGAADCTCESFVLDRCEALEP